MATFFITGTDTEVGKTIATGLLAKALLDEGKTVITQKWIQSGLSDYPEDIQTHLTLMNRSREDVKQFEKPMTPYRFQLPASAHLAAKEEGANIDPNYLFTCSTALAKQHDILLIEGLGGIHVPINDHQTTLDLVEQAKYPVILVIDNKLGCINHSLLSIDALINRKIPIEGLIFNHTKSDTPEKIAQDNIKIIETHSGLKSIAIIPHSSEPSLIKQNHSFWKS